MGTTPTISQVFGPGATQTATTVVIDKSWMTQYGLVPSADDTPEALLSAIVQKAAESLSEARRANNRNEQFVTVTYGGYDEIEDVPGAPGQVRRDVCTVITYTPKPLVGFTLSQYEE